MARQERKDIWHREERGERERREGRERWRERRSAESDILAYTAISGAGGAPFEGKSNLEEILE